MEDSASSTSVEWGSGTFDYKSGAKYEGEWKLFEGVKRRHGQGKYTYPAPQLPKPLSGAARMKILSQSPAPSDGPRTVRGSQIRLGTAGSQETLGTHSVFQNETQSEPLMLTEEYEGAWEEDVIHGYGVYRYKNEDVYDGMWDHGKYQGQGTYHFASGAKYTGDWVNHRMEGIGTYTDENGMDWSGIYMDGTYDSQIQKRLEMERVVNQKCEEIKQAAMAYLATTCRAVFEKEKKTWKVGINELLAFNQSDLALQYVSEPFSKFEERPPDKWNDVIGILNDAEFFVIRKAENSEFLTGERILGEQLKGVGQVVELKYQTETRKTDAAILQTGEDSWVILQVVDEVFKK